MLKWLNKLWSTLLRILLMLFGLMMVVGVMVVGAVVGVVLIGWALLSGRGVRPVAFRWNGPVDWRRSGHRPSGTPGRDVVDVEAREVDRPAPAVTRTPTDDHEGR